MISVVGLNIAMMISLARSGMVMSTQRHQRSYSHHFDRFNTLPRWDATCALSWRRANIGAMLRSHLQAHPSRSREHGTTLLLYFSCLSWGPAIPGSSSNTPEFQTPGVSFCPGTVDTVEHILTCILSVFTGCSARPVTRSYNSDEKLDSDL